MKLTRIGLDAFRSYVGVEFPTAAPLVYFAGRNAAGKTSIREAVKWALTGRCALTDGKGAGAEGLAPVTAGGLVQVSLDVDGLGKLARRLGPGLSVDGWTGTSSVQQTALYDQLAVSPAFLDAVLDSGSYLALGHSDAKALVLSLLDVKLQLADTVYTLPQWDAMYERAFADRRVAKQRLKDFRMPAAVTTAPMPTLAQVDAQLTRLRGELDAITREVGSTAGQRQVLLRQQADAKVRETHRGPLSYEEVLAQLSSLTRQLPDVSDDPPLKVGAAVAQISLEQTIARLMNHQPKNGCVIDCEVECKTAKLQFTKRAKDIRADLEAVPESESTPARAVAGMPWAELNQLQNEQAAYERVQRINAEREATYDRVTKELAALPDTAAQEQQIAVLKDRIAKGETVRQNAVSHWHAVDAMTRAEQERQTLQAEVNRLEELVATLGPNGARVQALADSLGRFAYAVNQFTAPFGWTVAFSAEPWAVTVNDREVQTYSRSEQFRIGIAVQLAIAHLSGLSFAIVDELDMLDVQNRQLMSKLLMAAGLDQVIVLATLEPGQKLPAMSGVLAYRLAIDQTRTVIAERSAA